MNATALGCMALLLVAATGVLWFRAVRAVRVPTNRSGFLAASLGGAGLGIAALAEGAGWIGGAPAVLAIFGGAFFSFTVAISRQKVAAQVISLGATVPDFTAIDENDETFQASSLAGHPALIKFFRGHW